MSGVHVFRTLLMIALATSTLGQQRPLTNEDVILTVKNHMAESVVLSAIQSRPSKFHVSTPELIRLKNLGVTDNEMNAMIAASGKEPSLPVTSPTAAASSGGPSSLIPFPAEARAQQTQNRQSKRSTSPTTGNSAKPRSNCGLLPISLLERTFGEKFDNQPLEGKMPPAYDGAWGATCKFSPAPPFSKGHPTTVEFIVFVEASAAEAKHTFEQTAAFLADTAKPKPGIGDASYWGLADKRKPRIAVLKGKTHFSLQLEPPNEDKLKELARVVTAQL